jgi:hypothetical protein
MFLALLLAQARVLPEIDRRALDLQARAEALQTRRGPAKPEAQVQTQRRPATTAAAVPAPTKPVARPTQQAAAPQRRTAAPTPRPASIRRAASGGLDLSAITTICRAAGSQSDPAGFLSTLTRAYSLTSAEGASLRTSCAAYLAGRADARVSNYGALGK